MEEVVAGFVRALNDLTKDPSKADVSITTDNYVGPGVLVSLRSAREHENEQAVGGLRNAARAVDRVPGWELVGHKLSKLIEEVVSEFEDNLDKVLSGLATRSKWNMFQTRVASLCARNSSLVSAWRSPICCRDQVV